MALRTKRKRTRAAENGFIPAGQFKKLGIPDWLLQVYVLIAERPTIKVKDIAKHFDQSINWAKQAIWKLRHYHKAIRPVHGHAICDLRTGHMSRRWGKTVKELIPADEMHLFFNEDGTRKLQRGGHPILHASEKAAFLTEVISGEIVKYIMANGPVKMPCWEYWDFAKKLGCDMHRIMRPDEELIRDACQENERLRTTGKRVAAAPGKRNGSGDVTTPGSEVCSREGQESGGGTDGR